MVKSSLPAALKRPLQYATGVLPRFTSASMLVSADAIAPSKPAFCAMAATTDEAALVVAIGGVVGDGAAASVDAGCVAAAAAVGGAAASAARLASRSFFSCATSALR